MDQAIDGGHDDDVSRTVADIEASCNTNEPEDHALLVLGEDLDYLLDGYDHKDSTSRSPRGANHMFRSLLCEPSFDERVSSSILETLA